MSHWCPASPQILFDSHNYPYEDGIFIFKFVHSLCQHVLSAYFVSVLVQGIGNAMVIKISKVPAVKGANTL
jgi:hypothetical protein